MTLTPSRTGSQLDGALSGITPPAPRPPELDIKTARELAARITPTAMEEFFNGVRTQTHNQLEALAFVLHEEYPNRITDPIKKEIAMRLVALRSEVVSGTPTTEEALKTIENRLEWVRRLLTSQPQTATVAPVQPTPRAVPPAPTFLGNFFSGLTTRAMTMFRGRPPTQQQVAAVQAQTSSITNNLTLASERIMDSLVATPELVSRIPVIGSMLAAPINIIGSLMGSTPESRRDRAERRLAERTLRLALAPNRVTCAVTDIDTATLALLKGPNPPTTPLNIVVLLQAWANAQRPAGENPPRQLTLGSVAELAPTNVALLTQQLQNKRALDTRATLTTSISTRLRRPNLTLTNGSDVALNGNTLTGRFGDLNTTLPAAGSPVVPGAPTFATTGTLSAGIRDFDDTGSPLTPEAKTLVGAMIKFPRATKIRITATGTPEMISQNELVIPVGSFDEAGVAVSNEAKTLVGMSLKFPLATKLKLATAGSNYELVNTTEFTAVIGGYNENGNPTSNEARKFQEATGPGPSGLVGATKITVTPRGNSEINNQNEFTINAATSISTLQRLASLAPDEAVRRIIINGGLLPRDVPILQRTGDEAVEINTHPNAAPKIAEVGWSAVLNALGNSTRLNLTSMRPITTT